MTVSSTTIKTAPFACDGATVTFAFTWKVWESSEVKVILRLVSDGSETTLTEGTAAGNYAVTLSSELPSAGSITTVTTYSNLYTITILANFPLTQEVDYGEGDKFPSKSHEEALDRGVRLSQQLTEQVERSLLLPESTSFSDLSLPEPEANKVLGWNTGATDLENKTPGSVLTLDEIKDADNDTKIQVEKTGDEDIIRFDVDGTQIAEMNSASFSIATGRLTFPATQNPSADVNTLDDYEEGTWTPVVADAAAAGNTGTADVAAGLYTKIGRLVHATIRLENISTIGMTGGNDFYIRGLPFTILTPYEAVGSVQVKNVTLTGYLTLEGDSNTKVIRLAENATGGGDHTLVNEVTSGSATIWAALTYNTAT